jgi:hypothetical protein
MLLGGVKHRFPDIMTSSRSGQPMTVPAPYWFGILAEPKPCDSAENFCSMTPRSEPLRKP